MNDVFLDTADCPPVGKPFRFHFTFRDRKRNRCLITFGPETARHLLELILLRLIDQSFETGLFHVERPRRKSRKRWKSK